MVKLTVAINIVVTVMLRVAIIIVVFVVAIVILVVATLIVAIFVAAITVMLIVATKFLSVAVGLDRCGRRWLFRVRAPVAPLQPVPR